MYESVTSNWIEKHLDLSPTVPVIAICKLSNCERNSLICVLSNESRRVSRNVNSAAPLMIVAEKIGGNDPAV